MRTKKIGLCLLLIAASVGTAFAAPYEVVYYFNSKKTTETWPTGIPNTTVTLEAKNEQDVMDQIASQVGCPASAKALYGNGKKWLGDSAPYNWENNGMSYSFSFVSVEKVKKQKAEKAPKAPKEPKKDWVDRNFPPLQPKK